MDVSTVNPVKLGFLISKPEVKTNQSITPWPYPHLLPNGESYIGQPSITSQGAGLLPFTNPWSVVASRNSTTPLILDYISGPNSKSFYAYVDFAAVIDPILNKPFAVSFMDSFRGLRYSVCTLLLLSGSTTTNIQLVIPHTITFKIENNKYIAETVSGCNATITKTVLDANYLKNLNIRFEDVDPATNAGNETFNYSGKNYLCNADLISQPQNELIEDHISLFLLDNTSTIGSTSVGGNICTLNFSNADLSTSNVTVSNLGNGTSNTYTWANFLNNLEFIQTDSFTIDNCVFDMPVVVQ